MKMDEREFQRMLERFPIVRKRTHNRVEWNAMYDKDGAKPTPQTAAPGPQFATITESDSLQSALTKFLQSYFTTSETQQIQREFEKAQQDFLSGLSLEDIDELCAQFVGDSKQ